MVAVLLQVSSAAALMLGLLVALARLLRVDRALARRYPAPDARA